MKAEKIKVITIKDFKDYPEVIVYIDENIAILNGLNLILKQSQDTTKLGCMMIVFCEEGEVMCNINGHRYLLQKDHCVILPPGTIICPHLSNTPHTIKIVAIEQSFLTDTLSLKKETWEVMHFLYKNHLPSRSLCWFFIFVTITKSSFISYISLRAFLIKFSFSN